MIDSRKAFSGCVYSKNKRTKNSHTAHRLVGKQKTPYQGIYIYIFFTLIVDEQDNEVVWPRKIRYSNTQEKIKS